MVSLRFEDWLTRSRWKVCIIPPCAGMAEELLIVVGATFIRKCPGRLLTIIIVEVR